MVVNPSVGMINARIGQMTKTISSGKGKLFVQEELQSHTHLTKKVILRALLTGMLCGIYNPKSSFNIGGNPRGDMIGIFKQEGTTNLCIGIRIDDNIHQGLNDSFDGTSRVNM